jgi:hypothetical protein
LPSVGEAGALATKFSPPGVGSAAFWTDDLFYDSGFQAILVHGDDASAAVGAIGESNKAVCVTDPSA